MMMRRVGLIIALTLGACGGTEPGDNNDVAEGHLIGTWDFSITGCPSTGNNGTVRLALTAGDLGENSTGVNVVTGASGWLFVENPLWSGAATGQVALPSGAVSLRVWRQTLSSGALLTGVVTAAGTFSGTMADPVPGYDPIFSLGCTYQVTGTRG